jgi:hypothetical protein
VYVFVYLKSLSFLSQNDRVIPYGIDGWRNFLVLYAKVMIFFVRPYRIHGECSLLKM